MKAPAGNPAVFCIYKQLITCYFEKEPCICAEFVHFSALGLPACTDAFSKPGKSVFHQRRRVSDDTDYCKQCVDCNCQQLGFLRIAVIWRRKRYADSHLQAGSIGRGPTQTSVMNSNYGNQNNFFNAPSRAQIYTRIMKLSEGEAVTIPPVVTGRTWRQVMNDR